MYSSSRYNRTVRRDDTVVYLLMLLASATALIFSL
jgi:hypothetical protein